MTQPIKRAFVLCAGKGERLRPITDTIPKPLVEVGGAPMLDRILAFVRDAGVEEVVINLHYLGDRIEEHLKNYPGLKIIFSREEELLETGGGIRRALHHFKGEPFYVLNGDAFWADTGKTPALTRLADKWDDSRMDILLMLHHKRDIGEYGGPADYWLPAGADQPVFAKGERKVPGEHVFGGIRIVHPRVFDGAEEGFYSFRDFLLTAEARGRLFALEHQGPWYHVGTPAELEKTNQLLARLPARSA